MIGRILLLALILSILFSSAVAFARSLSDPPLTDSSLIAYTMPPRCSAPHCQSSIILIDEDATIHSILSADTPVLYALTGKTDPLIFAYSDGIDIYLLDPSFRLTRRITSTGISDGIPLWSPVGSEVAYISYAQGGVDLNLFHMDETKGKTIRLRGFTPTFTYPFAWSPSGASLAYPFPEPARNSPDDIYVVDTTDSAIINVTQSDTHDLDPAWSRDGEQIAFSSGTSNGGTRQIYMVDKDGANLRQLTTTDGSKGKPHWVLDDSAILYEHYSNDGSYLELYHLASREITSLMDTRTEYRYEVSPDDTKAITVSGAINRHMDLCITDLRQSATRCLDLQVSSESRLAWIK